MTPNQNARVALVTGGSGQLGTAFCRALRRGSYRVYGGDLVRPVAGDSEDIGHVHLDVRDPISVDAGVSDVIAREGRLDLLINNAGVAVFTPFDQRTVDEYRFVFDVNVLGSILCTNAAAGAMKRQSTGGVIVNIASVYGIVSGDPRIYTDCARRTSEVYAGSKAAIIQMTRYWAVHLAPFKIRVNSVSPGGVYAGQGTDFVQRYSDKTPLGRMGEADDMAGAVVYLASDAAAYVTGQNLVVDGGFTIW
ncbi:MAG: SDR family oxidoreductase [Acidobacteria bacterium]|nr:SDR family oxidoreductase [Acidobacteriota bacterium]